MTPKSETKANEREPVTYEISANYTYIHIFSDRSDSDIMIVPNTLQSTTMLNFY